MDTPPKFEHGTISPSISVECAVVRVTSEDDSPIQESRLQGRLKNVSKFALNDVKCDLSYFDVDGRFLGLDVTSFTELDKIDAGETCPFDLELDIPLVAVRCVMNVHSVQVLQDIGVALQGYVTKTSETPAQS